MKRTKFPAKQNMAIEKFSYDELTKTEKAELIAIQTDIQSRIINIKKDIYEIGNQLHEAKKMLPHGMFISWIEQTFGNELPYNSAYFYMKVFETFKDNRSTIKYIPTKYLLMVTSRTFPEEIVNLLNEHPEKINKPKLQQINEVFELFKKGKIGGSQFIKIAKGQIQLGVDLIKGSTKHRINCNMRQSLYFGASDILKRINEVTKIASGMNAVYPYDPNNEEHKKVIRQIEKTISKLQTFKVELEGGSGLMKHVSTKEGDKYVLNI